MVIAEKTGDAISFQRAVATHDKPAFVWLMPLLWKAELVSHAGTLWEAHSLTCVGLRLLLFSCVLSQCNSRKFHRETAALSSS